MNWYYAVGGQQQGPVTTEALQALAASGQINDATLVWREGMSGWEPYANHKTAAASGGGGGMVTCSQCGGTFSQDNVIQFEGRNVCAGCKPAVVQGMKEGVAMAGTMEYAGFGTRFAAKFVDGLILGCFSAICIGAPMGFFMASSKADDPGANLAFQLIVNLISYGASAVYSIFFVAKYGATPGKMACKIRIVNEDGSNLSTGKAAGRFFAELLSMFTCYIGYIMAAFDDQKRALHDRVAGTRVIKNG